MSGKVLKVVLFINKLARFAYPLIYSYITTESQICQG